MKNAQPSLIGMVVLLSIIQTINAAASDTVANPCDTLTKEQSEQKQRMFKALYLYAGCDETLDKCLRKTPVHPSARHMASDICRLVKAGKTDAEIKKAMEERAKSLLPPIHKAKILLDPRTTCGEPSAPVTAVVYACARCPYCKILVLRLYEEVTQGSLKGKVKLVFRPFPIKSHVGSLEGGLAMEAAASASGFWPFLNLLYSRFDQFCPALLSKWAKEVGIDQTAFETAMADPKTKAAVIASKQEGILNKVTATPTVFINNTQYYYDMSEDVIEDVLLEAYETAMLK